MAMVYLLTACYLYFLYGWDDFGGKDVERFHVVDVGHAEDGLVDAHGCKACEMLDGGSGVIEPLGPSRLSNIKLSVVFSISSYGRPIDWQ